MYKYHGRMQILGNMAKVTQKKVTTGKKQITPSIFNSLQLPPGEWHSGFGWNELHLELLLFTEGHCKILRETLHQKIGLF